MYCLMSARSTNAMSMAPAMKAGQHVYPECLWWFGFQDQPTCDVGSCQHQHIWKSGELVYLGEQCVYDTNGIRRLRTTHR